MNTLAEKHLAKAQGYLAKGDGFYRKAAEEIVAAQEADHTLSNREIGERFDKSASWVRDIVRWSTTSQGVASPWAGKEHADNRAVAHTKRILRDAPLEQVEQVISELPRERQRAVAAAAGNEYLKARQDYDEEEKRLSIADRKERQATSEVLTQKVREASGGFASLGIAGHIDQATEELRELVADSSLTAETLRIVLAADAAWREELQVAAAMVGLEIDLQEV